LDGSNSRRRGLLCITCSFDSNIQFLGAIRREWGENISCGNHKDPICLLYVGNGYDTHFLPPNSSREATAALAAVSTSLSVPEMNSRPKRPTARTSIRLMLAAFSASLPASVTYAAGVASRTKRLDFGSRRLPFRHLLMSCAW